MIIKKTHSDFLAQEAIRQAQLKEERERREKEEKDEKEKMEEREACIIAEKLSLLQRKRIDEGILNQFRDEERGGTTKPIVTVKSIQVGLVLAINQKLPHVKGKGFFIRTSRVKENKTRFSDGSIKSSDRQFVSSVVTKVSARDYASTNTDATVCGWDRIETPNDKPEYYGDGSGLDHDDE